MKYRQPLHLLSECKMKSQQPHQNLGAETRGSSRFFFYRCGAVLVPGVELWVNVWCDILDGS
jgi:hypothetical protein